MTSILICARGYDSLSRARDFFELDADPTYVRHYVHDNIHEEYRDPSLYIRHLETSYKSRQYDHIVFWGVPSHIPHLEPNTYSCIFEDVDHILYPTASSSNALIAWWRKRKSQTFFEGARYVISLDEHSSQFLREYITGKEDQHFCLKALPMTHSGASLYQSDDNEVFFDHQNRIATLIGNDHTHDNIELFLKIAHTNKSLLIAGSDLRNDGYIQAQREYFAYFDTKEGNTSIPMPEITTLDKSAINTDILCLIDLHMTSGVSETLRWALSRHIPVITLNHHSIAPSLKTEGYPLILSLARLSEIPDLLSSLLGANGEHSDVWKNSQEILAKISKHLREDQKRSSRHMYFLIEKAVKARTVQK